MATGMPSGVAAVFSVETGLAADLSGTCRVSCRIHTMWFLQLYAILRASMDQVDSREQREIFGYPNAMPIRAKLLTIW